MRKRTISFLSDKLLWFILLTLPILFALVFTCATSRNYTFATERTSTIDTLVSSDELFVGIDGTTNFSNKLYFAMVSEPYDKQYSYTFDDIKGGLTYTLYNYLGPLGYGQMISDDNTAFFLRTGNYLVYNNISYYEYSVNFTVSGILGSFFDYIEAYGDDTSYGYGIVFTLSNSYILGTDEVLVSDSSTYFYSFFDSLNYSLDSWFTFGEHDIIFNAFNSIFGSQSNILPIFIEGSFIPKYLTYMGWIYILHVVFDLLVFIPRLAHKWLGKVYNDEDS